MSKLNEAISNFLSDDTDLHLNEGVNPMSYVVEIQVKDIYADADDYQLFDDPKSHIAAQELNDAVKRMINKSPARRPSNYRELERVMDKYAYLGANDSEPRRFVERILDYVYKD